MKRFIYAILCGGALLAPANAQGTEIDLSAGDVTLGETYTYTDTINVTGSGKLHLSGDGSASTGNWIFNAGTTAVPYGTALSGTADQSFGSGTITLNGASIFVPRTTANRTILNDVVFAEGTVNSLTLDSWALGGSGELRLFGELSGGGTINRTSGGYSLRLFSPNTNLTANWNLGSDWTWLEDADAGFGSGTITFSGGGIGLRNAKTLANDLVIGSSNFFIQGNQNVTLTGSISGAADIRIESEKIKALYLKGDGSAFTGDWQLAGVTCGTDSTVSSGEKDARFGSGIIYLNGEAVLSSNKTAAYILNDIVVTGTNYISADSAVLTFSGDISGTGDLYQTVGTGHTRFYRGDNSNFSGDFYVSSDYACMQNTKDPDRSMGTGTIYLTGSPTGSESGLRTSGPTETAVLGNDLVVPEGKMGCIRYGTIQINGTATIDGTLRVSSASAATAQGNAVFANLIQGDGEVRLNSALSGTLNPGRTAEDGTVEPGKLTFGDYGTWQNTLTLTENAVLKFDVLADGTFDQLAFDGADFVNQGEQLNVELVFADDFDLFSAAEAGESYQLVTGTDLSGQTLNWSSNLTGQLESGAVSLIWNLSSSGLTLSYLDNRVPEPSTWCLLVLGLGILGVGARKNHQKKSLEKNG